MGLWCDGHGVVDDCGMSIGYGNGYGYGGKSEGSTLPIILVSQGRAVAWSNGLRGIPESDEAMMQH